MLKKKKIKQVASSTKSTAEPQNQLIKLLTSAAKSVATLEWDKAVGLYTQALAVVHASPSPSATNEYDLLEKRSACYRRLGDVNAETADRLTQGKTEIRIGIGIALGQVIAGYTGTTRRATYTCVGDTVNLAARLELHTKVVGKPILIDSNTQSALSSNIKTDAEGPFHLKGKTMEVQVFSVPLEQKV